MHWIGSVELGNGVGGITKVSGRLPRIVKRRETLPVDFVKWLLMHQLVVRNVLDFVLRFTVDDEYTTGTAAAVRKWQGDRGLDRTGAVDPDEVIFAAEPLRVAGHPTDLARRSHPARRCSPSARPARS